jgi:hypothetical protein
MADYSQTYDKVCPEGPGGHQQIVNQDEAEILARTTQQGVMVRAEGMQEPGRH